MIKYGILALSLALAATSASANETEQADATQAQAQAQEKKICRSQKVTGSLTKVIRRCRTKAEWEQEAQLAKQGVDRTTSESTRYVQFQNAPGPGGS